MVKKQLSLWITGAALLVAPAAVPPSAERGASVQAANYGSGEMVGKVVNTSNRVLKRRVQVRSGGREWTLHIPKSAHLSHAGRRVSVHDLDVGTYVRAIGRRIGNTRLRATNVYVIGDRLAFLKSGYARRGGEAGYFASTAAYRTRIRR
jgi:hypothetical protein